MQLALVIAVALIFLVWWNKNRGTQAPPSTPSPTPGGTGTTPNNNQPPPGAAPNPSGSWSGSAGSGAGPGPGTSGSFPSPQSSNATDPMDAAMKAQGATWKGVRPGYAPMYEKPDVNPGIHFDWIAAGYTVTQL